MFSSFFCNEGLCSPITTFPLKVSMLVLHFNIVQKSNTFSFYGSLLPEHFVVSSKRPQKTLSITKGLFIRNVFISLPRLFSESLKVIPSYFMLKDFISILSGFIINLTDSEVLQLLFSNFCSGPYGFSPGLTSIISMTLESVCVHAGQRPCRQRYNSQLYVLFFLLFTIFGCFPI